MRRVIPLILVLLIVVTAPLLLGEPVEALIHGRILTSDGSPLANAEVVFYVYRRLSFEVPSQPYVFTTDKDGTFRGMVDPRAQYIVYAVAKRGETWYVPAVIDLRDFTNFEEVALEVALPEAAPLEITGVPIYLGGSWTGRFRVDVLNREGEELRLDLGKALVSLPGKTEEVKALTLNEYGRVDSTYHLSVSIGFSDRLVLVPRGYPVRLRVKVPVWDSRDQRVKWLESQMGTAESPLVLEGWDLRVDLLLLSAEGTLNVVSRDVEQAEKLVHDYESLGFYLADEVAMISVARDALNEAKDLLSKKENPRAVIPLLEEAYVIARDRVPKRIYFLRDVALEGGVILPFFLAFFSAILAFYFFDSKRAKIYALTALYAAFLVAFTVLYPGFPLLLKLNREAFLASSAAAYVASFFVLFVLPKYAPELEVPEKLTTLSALSISFVLAKRFSKVKRFRTVITVFGLAALIWAFTVLASFSSVYTKVTEPAPVSYAENLLVVRNVVEGVPKPLNPILDVEYLGEALTVYPRVHEKPGSSLLVRVKSGGKEVILHHALGLERGDPVVSLPSVKDSVLLPYSVFYQLGIEEGSTVEVIIEHEGYESQKLTLKVYGISEEKLSVKDPDGYSPLPFVVGAEVEPVNATDVAVFHWQVLIKALKREGGEFSEVFKVYSVAVKAEGNYEELANSIVDRRGGGYTATFCVDGACKIVKYGVRVESVFEQEIAFAIPLIIVALNVLITMLSIVRERRREIFVFVTAGFNPTHIAMVFMAEAVVYGLLSGGFGYIAGLATFRLLKILAGAQNLIIKEKLEWYWSFTAVLLSVFVSALGAFKPALEAAFMYAPAEVKKVKAPEKVKEKRKEVIAQVAAVKTYSYPQRINEEEAPLFFPYLHDKLLDLKFGTLERVENLEEVEEVWPNGTRVRKYTFNYMISTEGGEVKLAVELRVLKEPEAEKYRVEAEIRPVGKAPITLMEHVARQIRNILRNWDREKKRILG